MLLCGSLRIFAAKLYHKKTGRSFVFRPLRGAFSNVRSPPKRWDKTPGPAPVAECLGPADSAESDMVWEGI